MELLQLIATGLSILGITLDPNHSVKISYDEWWGPEPAKIDTSIREFKVQLDENAVTDLKERLNKHREWTPPLEGTAFEYGFNTDSLDYWVTYWADTYNFTERAEFLNQFPQYKTNIQGLDIHFVRVTAKVTPDVELVPLLLLHGWPSSTREFYKTLPLLTAVDSNRDFALDVIAPSLPGFGFSDAAVRPGLGSPEMAVILKNLMVRLGYSKFYIQGGDWGASIGTDMTCLFPEDILGFHTSLPMSLKPMSLLTYALGALNPSAVADPSVTDRMYPITDHLLNYMQELGYMHLQATKPDSVGVAMGDSPAGLLAYIFQLYAMAANNENIEKEDGGLEEYYTREDLLDTLTFFYWFTNRFTTSSRIYAETINFNYIKLGLWAVPTPVPVWTIHAKNEIIYFPPSVLKYKFTNIYNSTILPDGGHFLPLEQPEMFADNVLTAITAFRGDNEVETDDGKFKLIDPFSAIKNGLEKLNPLARG